MSEELPDHFHHESYCRKCREPMNPQTPDNEVKRPFGCKCETLRERVLGDGCDECNKALVIEMLTDEKDELTNEVARLREELSKAMSMIDRDMECEAEVERLRELMEWYKSGMESCWHAANTYDGNYTEACDNVMIIASARLNHKINFAPAPEEPVL